MLAQPGNRQPIHRRRNADRPAGRTSPTGLPSPPSGRGGEDSRFSGEGAQRLGEHGKFSVRCRRQLHDLPRRRSERPRPRNLHAADNKGASDTASLIVEIGKTPVAARPCPAIVPGPTASSRLRRGRAQRRQRVGRILSSTARRTSDIIDGAVFVPQLVLTEWR